LNDKFYADVQSLPQVKNIIKNWYNDFKKDNSLTNISTKDLEILDLEVTEFFDKYIETEPISHNYSEVLSYYLSNLERYWKDEMEKGRKNNVG
jgi:hypothetical protein